MTVDVNALVEANLKLVPHVIHKYLGGFNSSCEFDDLMGCGNIGLVKAARNYNPEFGVKFSTYAVAIIYGEMRRFLRDYHTIKFSRQIKDLYYRINKAELVDQDIYEIAAVLDVEVANVLDALAYGRSRKLASIDEPAYISDDGNSIILGDTIAVNQDFDFNLMVEDICAMLGTRGELVFRKYYLEGFSQLATAAEVGVSQAQVSRILTKIKGKVTEYIEGRDDMKIRGGRQQVGDHEKAKMLLQTTDMSANAIAQKTRCPINAVYKYKKTYKRVPNKSALLVSSGSPIGNTPSQEIKTQINTDVNLDVSCLSSVEPLPQAEMPAPRTDTVLHIKFDRKAADINALEQSFKQLLELVKAANLPAIAYSISISGGELGASITHG